MWVAQTYYGDWKKKCTIIYTYLRGTNINPIFRAQYHIIVAESFGLALGSSCFVSMLLFHSVPTLIRRGALIPVVKRYRSLKSNRD
jgi:hypothetical protein